MVDLTRHLISAARELQKEELRQAVIVSDSPDLLVVDVSSSQADAARIVEDLKAGLPGILGVAKGGLLAEHVNWEQFQPGRADEGAKGLSSVSFSAELPPDGKLRSVTRLMVNGWPVNTIRQFDVVSADGQVTASAFPARWSHLLGDRRIEVVEEGTEP